MKDSVLRKNYPGRKQPRKVSLFRHSFQKPVAESGSMIAPQFHTSLNPEQRSPSKLLTNYSSSEEQIAASRVTSRAADNPVFISKVPNQANKMSLSDSSKLLAVVSSTYKKGKDQIQLISPMRSLPEQFALDSAAIPTLREGEKTSTNHGVHSEPNVLSQHHTAIKTSRRLVTSDLNYTSRLSGNHNKDTITSNSIHELSRAISFAETPLCGEKSGDKDKSFDFLMRGNNKELYLSTIDAPNECSSGHGSSGERGNNEEQCSSLVYDAVVENSNVLLTDELLRNWIGLDDLDLVLSTELHFDAEKLIGLDKLSVRLPRLTSLKLNRSNIPHFRLLGARYTALKHLWVSNCHLKDLCGIGACTPALVELYASFNYITDLSPLMDVADTLQVADFEGNEVVWTVRLRSILCSLCKLVSLNLQGNPVEKLPLQEVKRIAASRNKDRENVLDADVKDLASAATFDFSSFNGGVQAFREWIHFHLPQLQILDDTPLCNNSLCTETLLDNAKGRGEGAENVTEEVTNSASQSSLPLLASAISEASNPNRECNSLYQKVWKGHNQVYIDPLDTALTEELCFLQDCIRSTQFDDPLDRTVELHHRGLYTRPSTCAAAQTRSAMSDQPNGCTSDRRAFLRGTGAESRQASTSYSKKVAGGRLHQSLRCTQVVNASSSLTMGNIFSGSATVCLRKRLLAEQQQCPTSSMAFSKTVTENDDAAAMATLHEPASSKYSMSGTRSSSTISRVADSDNEIPGASFDDEDFFDCGLSNKKHLESEWERLKSAGLEYKNRCQLPSTCEYFESYLHAYFNDHITLFSKRPASAEEAGEDLSEANDSTLTELLKKEVARTRAQIAREGAKSISDAQHIQIDNSFWKHRLGLKEDSVSSESVSRENRSDSNRCTYSCDREVFSVNVLDLTAE